MINMKYEEEKISRWMIRCYVKDLFDKAPIRERVFAELIDEEWEKIEKTIERINKEFTLFNIDKEQVKRLFKKGNKVEDES